MDIDLQVRLAVFNWLSEQVNSHGDVLPTKLLEQGFEFQGQRISLVAPQGFSSRKSLICHSPLQPRRKVRMMIILGKIIS